MALAGCAGGGGMPPSRTAYDPSQLAMGNEIAAAWREAAGPQGSRAWWTAWGDAQLNTLMALAEQDAPSIQLAESRLRKAAAANAGSASALMPALVGSASVNADHFPGHYTYPEAYAKKYGSEGRLGVDLAYHLDFWGKWRNAAAAAALREEAARLEVSDARLVLETALVSAYVKLDKAYRLRDLARRRLDLHSELLRLLELRRTAGLATDIDAVQVRDAITRAASDQAGYSADIARCRQEIATLVGKTPAFADALHRPRMGTLVDPAPLSNITATLLGFRPDVWARRRVVESAATEIDVAKEAFFPDLNLVAFAGLQSLGLGYLMRTSSTKASIGPAVTLPIFEGGRLRADLKGRVAEYDEAVSAYNATLVIALQQVADGLATLNAARERQQQARASIAHWGRIVDLQKIRQRNGLSDASDLLAAETTLSLSQGRGAEVDAEVADAQTALIRSLGGAWSPSSPVTLARINHD